MRPRVLSTTPISPSIEDRPLPGGYHLPPQGLVILSSPARDSTPSGRGSPTGKSKKRHAFGPSEGKPTKPSKRGRLSSALNSKLLCPPPQQSGATKDNLDTTPWLRHTVSLFFSAICFYFLSFLLFLALLCTISLSCTNSSKDVAQEPLATGSVQ
jgi:hypothetical protein